MIQPIPYIGEPATVPLVSIDTLQQIRTRNGFDEQSLKELAATIREVGIIEPLIVRPSAELDGRYVLVAGERRLLAASMAGLAEVPVIVRDIQPQQANLIQAIENLHRENLTLADTAAGVAQLLLHYKTAKDTAKALGKSPAWVSKHTSLANLKGPVRIAMDAGISEDPELLLSLEQLRRMDSDSFARELDGLETGSTTRATVRGALQEAKKPKLEASITAAGELVIAGDEDRQQDTTEPTGDVTLTSPQLALLIRSLDNLAKTQTGIVTEAATLKTKLYAVMDKLNKG